MSSIVDRRNTGTKRHGESAVRKRLWRNSGSKAGVGGLWAIGVRIGFRDKVQLRS